MHFPPLIIAFMKNDNSAWQCRNVYIITKNIYNERFDSLDSWNLVISWLTHIDFILFFIYLFILLE